MNAKKILLLFLALLFPACIFVFLKFFGQNEFAVPPLYTDVIPDGIKECGITLELPYHIADSIHSTFSMKSKPLSLIHFGNMTVESETQLERVKAEHATDVNMQFMPASKEAARIMQCVFFLKNSYNLVLVDKEGLIRGQYISGDREEMDRLLTELTILLKRY